MSEKDKQGKRSGRKARRQAETRKRLLDAARKIFATTALTSATIAQITERADLGFGTFYLHFSSKEDIYLAVLKKGFSELGEELDVFLDKAKESEYAWDEIIESAIAKFFHFAGENSDLFQVGFAGFDAGMRVGVSLRERYADWFAELLREIHPLDIPDCELELLSTAIVAMVNRSAVWWMQQNEESEKDFLSLEEVSAIVSRFAIAGLADFDSISKEN
ncbi:MAG: TetR/AcrR family transcriptional regulator [Prochloraceae cyanobacterium]|nr:TetR/AcrR family transcriptional regulator [Prochloraceae cyanobacterium]